MAPWKAAVFAVCVGLGGCDLFSVRPFEARPERLRPERDAFSDTSTRDFLWVEYLDGPAPDSPMVLRSLSLRVLDRGDTLLSTGLRRHLEFQTADGSPLPVSVVTILGFDPLRLSPDPTVADAGPSLPFPEFPQPGWRSENISGDLRFVREFRGMDTLDRLEGLVETYVFAESTYWDNKSMATGQYWFGKRGLLRQTSQWPDFGSENAPLILHRDVTVP